MDPPAKKTSYTTCGLCGSADASSYLKVGEHALVRCRTCGLVRVADFQPAEALYAGNRYFTGPDGYIERWDTFRTIFQSIVERIRRIKPDGTLLDVGASVGILMEVASGKGYAVKGVELSEWASDYAREEKGLDVVSGTLEDARFGDASFDIVVLNHVLEHVDAPKSLLSEIRRILKNDGLLVIGVPNARSIMAKLIGARWASWRPEQHVWHFTPATLSALVRTVGFDVIRSEAKDNSPVTGWGAKDIARRVVNAISVMANRSESMLIFARKSGTGAL